MRVSASRTAVRNGCLRGRQPQTGTGSHVCRVTNLGEEKPALETRIVNVPLLKRNGQPLYMEVECDLFEGASDDKISVEDMEYWFTADEEVIETQYLEPAVVLPNSQFSVRNYELGQAPISTLAEGDIVSGPVTSMHLLHGAVLDLGCEYDGLIPIGPDPEQWDQIGDGLTLDMVVTARIHKIRDPDIFRFPVQLEVLDPALASMLCQPDEWRCPVEIREDTDIQKLIALSQPDYEVKKLAQLETRGEIDPELQESQATLRFNEMYSATAERPEAPLEGGGERPMDDKDWEAAQIAAMFL